MGRFSKFTLEELDAMEEAFCNEGLKSLVDELRIERHGKSKYAADHESMSSTRGVDDAWIIAGRGFIL